MVFNFEDIIIRSKEKELYDRTYQQREDVKQRRREKEKTRSQYDNWIRSTKQRAKQKGLPNDLTVEYLKSLYTSKCSYLHIQLNWNNKKGEDNSPSLDRIDNTKGYVKGNVQVISRLANQMKSTATFEQFETMYFSWKNQLML